MLILNARDIPPASINDGIQACIDAVNAQYDALILIAESELQRLKNQLTGQLNSCEYTYSQDLKACGPFVLDPLCPVKALTKRNECVYNAQTLYGICCVTRILGVPVGGPPCCQSGLCSCTDDLTDPDNMGPQVNKQQEIDRLKFQKQRDRNRCIDRADEYLRPVPVVSLIQPVMRDNWRDPRVTWHEWYRRRRPVPIERRRFILPDIGIDEIVDDPYRLCLYNCWLRYDNNYDFYKSELDLALRRIGEIIKACEADAENEYRSHCPTGSENSLDPLCRRGGNYDLVRQEMLAYCKEREQRLIDEAIGGPYGFNDNIRRISLELELCYAQCAIDHPSDTVIA
jgi:hypothetical protein